MLDGLEEDLLEICKNLEKSLIQNFIVSHSYATSENRKQMLKMMKKERIEAIKSTRERYVEEFSIAAKGKWVTQAKQLFKETTSRLANCLVPLEK